MYAPIIRSIHQSGIFGARYYAKNLFKKKGEKDNSWLCEDPTICEYTSFYKFFFVTKGKNDKLVTEENKDENFHNAEYISFFLLLSGNKENDKKYAWLTHMEKSASKHVADFWRIK